MFFPLLCTLAAAQEPQNAPEPAAPKPAAPKNVRADIAGEAPADDEPVDLRPAEPKEPVDPAVTHEALRALRTELHDALQSRNVDALLKTLHPNVVFTTSGGDALRGREGVRAYFEKMLEGPDAIVKSFAYDIQSDELSILHGDDMAIAWGPSHDHYEFTGGETIDMDTRWSATLVWDEGRWLIASGHSSLPAFDNALLNTATGMVPKAGFAGLLGGLFVGSIGGLLIGRATKRS